MTPDDYWSDEFWNDPFHISALMAGAIAQKEGRLQDSEYVRRLAYDLYEQRKKTGR